MTRRSRSPYALPLEAEVLLAELYLRGVLGCKRAALARPSDDLAGHIPLPWAIGHAPTVLIEPWSLWAALHNRKRGFTHVTERIRTLSALAHPERLELWENQGEIDRGLIAKWEAQTGVTIVIVDRSAMAAIWRRFEAEPPAAREHDGDRWFLDNPLAQLFRTRLTLLGAT